MTILEREEFQRWKDQPLTRDFLRLCRERHLALGAAWARGLCLAPEQQAQAVLLGQLAEISFEGTDTNPGIHRLFGLEAPEAAEVSE